MLLKTPVSLDIARAIRRDFSYTIFTLVEQGKAVVNIDDLDTFWTSLVEGILASTEPRASLAKAQTNQKERQSPEIRNYLVQEYGQRATLSALIVFGQSLKLAESIIDAFDEPTPTSGLVDTYFKQFEPLSSADKREVVNYFGSVFTNRCHLLIMVLTKQANVKGELPDEQDLRLSDTLRQHLNQCPVCRQSYRQQVKAAFQIPSE